MGAVLGYYRTVVVSMVTQLYRSPTLSVITCPTAFGEAIEFMWIDSGMWLGRLEVWQTSLAGEIFTEIVKSASSEEDALAIFDAMKHGPN